ncbi:hypothetical protein FIBSPDRAFT_1042388 [Athelia psychrophila]|uniref:Uncharacterized protein n=1 Tax=Athelia psychrophila TaxID=1759441 RepID=A0A166MKF3_9AGAM|nr:hypothetical protein FIBSPDRAFT_1042388 [Fibularhizoctonia sp. CBS 109695]
MGTSMRWARAIEADIRVQRTIHLPVLIGTHECALDAHNARSSHRLPSKTPSSDAPSPPPHPASPFQPLPRRIATLFRSIFKVTFADQSSKDNYEPEPKTHAERENNALGFVRAPVARDRAHGAEPARLRGGLSSINALILVPAAGRTRRRRARRTCLTRTRSWGIWSGNVPAALLFALASLVVGRRSLMITAVAGQKVSEGFLRWRVSPTMRCLVTRLIGLVLSLIIAAAGGRSGLLVASQVIPSVVPLFVTLPLIYPPSSKAGMSVCAPASLSLMPPISVSETAEEQEREVNYSSGKVATRLDLVDPGGGECLRGGNACPGEDSQRSGCDSR